MRNEGTICISVKLGLKDAAATEDQAVSRDLVLEWLLNPVRKVSEGGKLLPDAKEQAPRWLSVFDSAYVGLLRDYWPAGGKGSITSRDPLAETQTYVQSNKGIILDPFTLKEASL